jgi:hypothetical protein
MKDEASHTCDSCGEEIVVPLERAGAATVRRRRNGDSGSVRGQGSPSILVGFFFHPELPADRLVEGVVTDLARPLPALSRPYALPG